MLWALGFSPRLLLPSELWPRLGTEQQDTLLAHELAHLRRGDHWVRRLELLVLGLYWWHPVVWWARRRLQEAEEECCDAVVVAVLPDAASAYASALVETVAFLSQSRAAALVGASGAGQVPLLKRRLTMILTANPSRQPSRLAFWTVLALGALLLPLAPGAAWTEAPEKPGGVETKNQRVAPHHPSTSQEDPWLPVKLKVFAENMRDCTACHATQKMRDLDVQGKPQSWRKAHDDVVRLMDEVRRRQAQLGEAAKRLPAAVERDRGEEIEKLQDDIELLRLQVRLKEARLRGANTSLPLAQKRLERLRHAGNAVSIEVILTAETTVATLKAEIEVKEVELQEARLLLKQAERRLARLQRPAEKTDGGGRTQQEKRLRELEQKVESLLKEIHKLRKEMRPSKPREQDSEHKETVEQHMIHVIVRMQGGKPVVQVENQAVDTDNLVSELRRYVKATKKSQMLLGVDEDIPHRIVIDVQDAARAAGMEKVLIGVPDNAQRQDAFSSPSHSASNGIPCWRCGLVRELLLRGTVSRQGPDWYRASASSSKAKMSSTYSNSSKRSCMILIAAASTGGAFLSTT